MKPPAEEALNTAAAGGPPVTPLISDSDPLQGGANPPVPAARPIHVST